MFRPSLHRASLHRASRYRSARRLAHIAPASAFVVLLSAGVSFAEAATVAPPMLDITRQCDLVTKHNVTAMSECVVAESEARADLLQNWAKLPDDTVEKCIKIGRKAKRQPYTAMEKCLAPDLAVAAAPPPASAAKK